MCYKKHGFPPHFGKRSNASVNNVTTEENEDNVTANLEVSQGSTSHSGPILTQEQYDIFVSLVQQIDANNNQHKGKQVITNQVKTLAHNGHMPNEASNTGMVLANSTKQFSPQLYCLTSYTLSCTLNKNSNSWILDSGANDHICSSLMWFTTYYKIKPIGVQLPNGNLITAKYAGNVHFSSSLVLVNVLYLPEFSFNLVSVSKLCESSNCDVHFSNPSNIAYNLVGVLLTK